MMTDLSANACGGLGAYVTDASVFALLLHCWVKVGAPPSDNITTCVEDLSSQKHYDPPSAVWYFPWQ